MPIPIKSPTGDIVNFPDGTSDSTIESVMAREYPRPNAAPDVPVPEGFQKSTAAPVNAQETWLSQHPDQAGSLSHVIGEAYRGLKKGFGDAPLSSSIPSGVPTHLGYIPNPLAVAAEIGGTGLRALGAIPSGVYGAAKGVAETIGATPTQAEKFGSDIGGMPESVAGVVHTLPPITRNIARPGAFEEFAASAKASPVPAMTRTAANRVMPFVTNAAGAARKAVSLPGTRADVIAKNLRSSLGPESVAAADMAANDAAMQAFANKQIVTALETKNPYGVGTIDGTSLQHEIGGPLQEAAVANEAKMVKDRADIYGELQKARNDINTDNVNKGILPENMPSYQKLEAKLQPIVAPNPATASRIVAQNDPGVKNVYKRISDTVISKELPLDEAQVAEAKAAGYGNEIIARPVSGGPAPTTIVRNGVETQYPPQQVQYFRKFSNSFDAIDDARRFLGKVFAGRPPEGYEAISGVAHKDLYTLLDQLEKEYAGNAQTALQNHWSSATKKLDVFDTKAGKLLTDTQGDTGVLKTSPSEIPKKFFGKGPDAYQNLIDVTGNPALAKKQVTRWVSSELANLSGKQATAKAEKLADMLSHPSLTELRGKVEANVNSKNLADIANKARQGELIQAESKLTSANKSLADAEQLQIESRTRAKVYEGLNPRKAVAKAESDLTSDRKAGRISEAQFNDSIDKVRKAQRLYGYSTKLKIALGGIVLATAARGPVGRAAIQYVLNSGL